MTERNIDAFVIPGTENQDPYRDYLTGGVSASALVVKKRGEDPLLIVNLMEVDEAAKSGLRVMTYDEFDEPAIHKRFGRGTAEAKAALWHAIFDKLSISGNVTLYGIGDLQVALGTIEALKDR